MNSIAFEISEEQYEQLQALANDKGISPIDLLSSEMAGWLDLQRNEFTKAADYVPNQNSEPSKRSA